jgi:hypothetical protein
VLASTATTFVDCVPLSMPRSKVRIKKGSYEKETVSRKVVARECSCEESRIHVTARAVDWSRKTKNMNERSGRFVALFQHA